MNELIKILILSIEDQSCHHVETSQMICFANQLTGFCMIATLVFNGLLMIISGKVTCSLNLCISFFSVKHTST